MHIFLNHKHLPLLMWALPLMFFAFQLVLRVYPSLIIDQIIEQFAINASDFGILASLYYYGYSAMQVPLALIIRKLGVRYTLFSCALLCGIATLVFSCTTNWYVLCISRCFVGVGSAAAYLGVSTVIGEWFPKNQYAKMVGFSFSIGLLGAIYGGRPVSIFIKNYTHQKVCLVLALISILISFLIYLFLRKPNKIFYESEAIDNQSNSVKKIFFSPTLLLLGISSLLMVGSLEGFSDVWGVNYLVKAYGISKAEAAGLTSFIFIGMIFGGPLLATVSRLLDSYLVICICGLCVTIAFIILISKVDYNWYLLASLFFIVGLMCCYQVIVFDIGSNLVSSQLAVLAIAFLNCINMLGGSFFHTIIGVIMDIFWTGIEIDGIRQYTLWSYKAALMTIPICSITGTIIVGLIYFNLQNKSVSVKTLHQIV